MDDRARVPTGHDARPLLVQAPGLRIALDVAPLGIGGEGGELGDRAGTHLGDRTVSAAQAATVPVKQQAAPGVSGAASLNR